MKRFAWLFFLLPCSFVANAAEERCMREVVSNGQPVCIQWGEIKLPRAGEREECVQWEVVNGMRLCVRKKIVPDVGVPEAVEFQPMPKPQRTGGGR